MSGFRYRARPVTYQGRTVGWGVYMTPTGRGALSVYSGLLAATRARLRAASLNRGGR